MKKSYYLQDELIQGLESGTLSRRRFNQLLGAFGISLVVSPMLARKSIAGVGDQATYFTWGGWDLPDLFPTYTEKHNEPPNFATFGSSEEGFTKMRAGFVVDLAHAYNVEIPRWVESGLFQQWDISRLSNWSDVIPELWELEGNMVNDKPYFVPFDWGQTSITYRTDLVELKDGEESWGLLWDERYAGQIGQLGAAGDAWWCAAIYAGVDFAEIATKENIEKVAELLRKQRPLIRTYTDEVTSLEQALASGELVAAMTWNSSAVALQAEGIPVKFAKPKEGALTWVGGMMLHQEAPHADKAHDVVDALISYDRGRQVIAEDGYGHCNLKALQSFSDEELEALGLSKDVLGLLNAGKFMIPQGQEFETASNTLYEEIKAGF